MMLGALIKTNILSNGDEMRFYKRRCDCGCNSLTKLAIMYLTKTRNIVFDVWLWDALGRKERLFAIKEGFEYIRQRKDDLLKFTEGWIPNGKEMHL